MFTLGEIRFTHGILEDFRVSGIYSFVAGGGFETLWVAGP